MGMTIAQRDLCFFSDFVTYGTRIALQNAFEVGQGFVHIIFVRIRVVLIQNHPFVRRPSPNTVRITLGLRASPGLIEHLETGRINGRNIVAFNFIFH